MGNKSSLPNYEEIENFHEEMTNQRLETQDHCALDILRDKFESIVISSPLLPCVTEEKIFNLIVAAKTYGLLIPVKKIPYTEFTKLKEHEKIEFNRFNLEIISDWIGGLWIES